MLNGVTSVVAVIAGMYFMTRLPRKFMLVTGPTGTASSLFAISMVSMLVPESLIRGFLVLFCMVVFLAFMQGFIGCVTWLTMSEIFPLHVRGVAMGICVFVLWVVNFLVGFFFPQLVAGIGVSSTFFIFVVLQICAIVWVKKMVPETRGKSLEELEQHFKSAVSHQTSQL